MRINKRIRRKVSSNKFKIRRFRSYKKLLAGLETFYSFECSSFFVGDKVAKYNTKLYFKYLSRYEAQFDWYLKRID